MNGTEFDMTIRVTVLPIADGWSQQLRCPACEAPLEIHQPDTDVPRRLLASCSCEECGIWFSVVPSVDRTRVYLLRIPSVAEMREALVRKGWS